MQGLKDIAESLISEDINTPSRDVFSQDGIERLDNQPRTLLRLELKLCAFSEVALSFKFKKSNGHVSVYVDLIDGIGYCSNGKVVKIGLES